MSTGKRLTPLVSLQVLTGSLVLAGEPAHSLHLPGGGKAPPKAA